MLAMYLDQTRSLCHSPSHLSILIKTISAGFIVLFQYKYAVYINHFHAPLPSPFNLLSPTSTSPEYNLFYILVHFFKAYIHCLKGFPGYFTHKYIVIQSDYNQTNPPDYSFFSYLLVVQQLSVCFIMTSSNTDTMYFNVIHYHFLSLCCLPQAPQTAVLLLCFSLDRDIDT
jgi:hypothetical protein